MNDKTDYLIIQIRKWEVSTSEVRSKFTTTHFCHLNLHRYTHVTILMIISVALTPQLRIFGISIALIFTFTRQTIDSTSQHVFHSTLNNE